MNRSAIIGYIVALAALGFAAYKTIALQRTQATMENLNAERVRVVGELDNVKQRLEISNQRLVQAELQAASLKEDFSRVFAKPDGAATATTGTVGRTQQGFYVGGFRRGGSFTFRSNPPGKALDTTYHALYRQLKLSAEQIEAFKAIITEATDRFSDLDREAKRKQVSVTAPAMQPLYAKVDSDLRAGMSSRFGEDALPLIERFTETLFLREPVSQVANELFYSDAPLSEVQANQLVDIMAKHMRDPAGRLNPTFADGSAMKADAAAVLSPPQLEVWREFIDYMTKTSSNSLNRPRR